MNFMIQHINIYRKLDLEKFRFKADSGLGQNDVRMNYFRKLVNKVKKYLKRLVVPVYLFPVKLITFSTYYLIKFLIKLLLAFFSLIIDCLIFPFKSLKNFLKSLFFIAVGLYLFATLVVITDYLVRQYGSHSWNKFFCTVGVREKLQKSVVRVVGGYSEGSGFFIAPDQVVTNFHVIANEPSPKIIFPDGKFITPIKITGSKNMDLAVLYTEEKYPDLVFTLPDRISLSEDEPLLATGYPLGTDLSGKATTLKGTFIDFRQNKTKQSAYVQTDINLVEGMSGGILTDQCGSAVGVNTLGLAGLSLFINADQVKAVIPKLTDQEIKKVSVDPSVSPEEAVRAYYTFLKARKMKEGFNLLSSEYLQRTNFEEWTNRFKDILDVEIFKSERFQNSKDTAFVKFSTKNWVEGEVAFHYYEGTWVMILENGVFKIKNGRIFEVDNPGDLWFYE